MAKSADFARFESAFLNIYTSFVAHLNPSDEPSAIFKGGNYKLILIIMKKFFKSFLITVGLLFLDVCTKAANVKFVITQNPNIGRARKQIGGWIFYKHYTKNVARSRPIEVKPNNSPLRLL